MYEPEIGFLKQCQARAVSWEYIMGWTNDVTLGCVGLIGCDEQLVSNMTDLVRWGSEVIESLKSSEIFRIDLHKLPCLERMHSAYCQ